MAGRLKDVMVPIEVVLGGTELSLDEISSIGPGTVIKLESLAGEPVQVRASGTTIARAEVVVVDDSFGIKVTEVVEEEGD